MKSAMVDFVKSESAVSDTERAFQIWYKQVTQHIGDTVDGDWAFDLFADGCSVKDAVAEMMPK